MHVAPSEHKWQFALVDLDDIVVFSSLVAEHIDHVRDLLSPLRHAGDSLNLKTNIIL